MKVVINKCHGGFGLSFAAVMEIAKLKGYPCFMYERVSPGSKTYRKIDGQKNTNEIFFPLGIDLGDVCTEKALNEATHLPISYNIDRYDPDLVEVVERMGKAANGPHAELGVVEVPDDVDWEIDDYDGSEWVAERHRTWS